MKTSSRSRSSLSKHPLNAVPTMQDLATKYLGPVQRRLNGINTWKAKKGFEADKGADGMGERPRGVPAFVEFLIKEARDSKNLVSRFKLLSQMGYRILMVRLARSRLPCILVGLPGSESFGRRRPSSISVLRSCRFRSSIFSV